MKRLIVHAGLPKTGSTALQVFLARNAATLRRRGFDYFALGEFDEGRAGKISSGNGFLVARSLLPDGDPNAAERPAAHLSALARAIAASPCQTGIVSSEYFAHCDPAKLKAWAGALREMGCEARMMYFIREQAQALCSMYVQYVKRSHCRETPEAYIERTYRGVPYLMHARFYATQCDSFGAGNVICRTYESALRAEGGICGDFLAAIGADAAELPAAPETVNSGLSPAELAIMRELNKFRPHTRLSDQLMENNRRAGNAHSGEIYEFLPDRLRREIEAYFATENAEMGRLAFGGEALYPAAALANAPVAIGDYSQTDLVNVLGGLLIRYDERLAYLETELAAARRTPLRRLIRGLMPGRVAARLSAFYLNMQRQAGRFRKKKTAILELVPPKAMGS